jgi:hypothetical protein
MMVNRLGAKSQQKGALAGAAFAIESPPLELVRSDDTAHPLQGLDPLGSHLDSRSVIGPRGENGTSFLLSGWPWRCRGGSNSLARGALLGADRYRKPRFGFPASFRVDVESKVIEADPFDDREAGPR